MNHPRHRIIEKLRRQWLSARLRTKGLFVVSIPMVSLLLMTAVYIASDNRLHEAEALIARTHLVKEELHALIADIFDAEADVRGYLLTRDLDWIAEFDGAQARLSWRLTRLDAVVIDPEQRALLEGELALTARARLKALHRTVEIARASGIVQDEVLTNGRMVMGQLDTIVRTMIARQEWLLQQRRAQSERIERWVNMAIATSTLIGLGGGAVAAMLLSGGIVRRVGQLGRDAQRVAAGELLPATPDAEAEAEADDEIGALRRLVKETADTLRSRAHEIETTKAELDSFFTVTPDMLCLASTEGVFTRVNPAWSTLGWSPEQLTCTPYIEFVHPDDRESTLQRAAALATGDTIVSFENRYATPDGSYRWLSWHACLDRRTGLIAAVARDSTEQKATEARLTQLNVQLQEATRAKNDFLSRMSHDLRTPLNAVIGFAQVLESGELIPDQRASVGQILNGARHLLHLVDEVLQIARAESGYVALSTEPVSITEVVTSAVALVGPLAEQRGLHLLVDVGSADAAPWVMADRQRLSDILLNLLSNAVKYNRPAGSIAVTITNIGDRTRVSVTDTGFGIPAAKRLRLFTPFDRLGAEGGSIEGTGLGLALSKSLANAMGGDVGASSQVDVGSTFWVELARTSAPSLPAVIETTEENAVATAASGVVLYIDDTQSNLVLVKRILQRRAGVTLVTAVTGEEGIRLAAQHQPALIMLDLHLPDMHGENVLQRLWESPPTREIPIVIVSADATPTTSDRMLGYGAVGYLRKPLDIHRLLRVVDEHLAPRVRA